jgi:hypothetical protein
MVRFFPFVSNLNCYTLTHRAKTPTLLIIKSSEFYLILFFNILLDLQDSCEKHTVLIFFHYTFPNINLLPGCIKLTCHRELTLLKY